METTTWQVRLALLLLCAPMLHSGFVTMSDAGEARQLLASAGVQPGAGASMMTVLNAMAAMLVVLFEGRLRRCAAWWLAVVVLLGALILFPFWAREGLAQTRALQSFLSAVAYASAFALVAGMSRPAAPSAA